MSELGYPEIEIKIDLQEIQNYNKLLEYLDVNESPIYQLNAFFDSEDRQLFNEGWTLRVRILDDRGVITSKGLSINNDQSSFEGLSVREEMEEVISRRDAVDIVSGKLDALRFISSPSDFIRNRFPIDKLIKRVEFQNYRIKKKFSVNQQLFFFELDKSIFPSQFIDYEAEIELSAEIQYTSVVNWIKKLFVSLSIPLKFQARSKYQRALEHLI